MDLTWSFSLESNKIMPIIIRENVILSSYTTFRIGGPARYFCEVKTLDELNKALDFAKKNNLEIFILGGGSNLLISDEGFQGLVVKILSFKLRVSRLNIEVEAGISLGRVAMEAVKNGLAGLEWAAGIPGSIGGAVFGNAGAFGGAMGDIVKKVEAVNIKTGKIEEFTNKRCGFSYRDSVFKKQPGFIIWSVKLLLKKGVKDELKKSMEERIAYRVSRHPLDLPSSGSFFKNVSGKDAIKRFLKQCPFMEDNIKRWGNIIPTGYLIDECGLRGKKIGDAMISSKHANFIVNFNNARAEDVIILISMVKQRVRNKFGILLEEEVRLVGF